MVNQTNRTALLGSALYNFLQLSDCTVFAKKALTDDVLIIPRAASRLYVLTV